MKRPLTQSMIRDFNRCPRKYYYKYIDLYKRKAFHLPFLIGGAVHIGVPHLFKTKRVDESVNKALICLRKQKAEFEKIILFSGEEDQEFIYQSVCVESMIRNYSRFYSGLISSSKMKAFEEIIEFPILNLSGGFILTAKIDSLLFINRDEPLLYELKTTKNLGYDHVMLHYPQSLYYFITTFQKYNTKRIYIDMIQKPTIRQTKTETQEQFITRLDEYYTQSQNFYSEIIRPEKRHVNQMINITRETAKKIVEAEDKSSFYCNRFSCRLYGACEFLDFCDYGVNAINTLKFVKKTSINEELGEEK